MRRPRRSGYYYRMMKLGCAAAALLLAACVTSHVLVGRARAPILPDQVQLFLEPPKFPYEQIAVLSTSSKHSFTFTAQAKSDVVIKRLKEEAASLGANGIVLQEITDEPMGSFDTGVGTEISGARGTVDLGIGGSTLMLQKYGRGIAVYAEPSQPRN
jgi:hypothetical protein